jgi:hypothetical protein
MTGFWHIAGEARKLQGFEDRGTVLRGGGPGCALDHRSQKSNYGRAKLLLSVLISRSSGPRVLP